MEKQELKKLKRDELLEIMLAQSEEIDRLRAKVEELEKDLNDRELKFKRIGSIAEASLAVTKIFEEAEKSAVLYVENVRRRADKEFGVKKSEAPAAAAASTENAGSPQQAQDSRDNKQ